MINRGRPKTYRNKTICADEYTLHRLRDLFNDASSASEALEMLIDGIDAGLYGIVSMDMNKHKLLKGNRKRRREHEGRKS